MEILIALIVIALGVTLITSGYRIARLIIPLFGFITGLSLGGAIISNMAGTPFLGTVLGIGAGLVFGVILALFAYLYYAAAVIVSAGLIGYWLGSSMIQLIGLEPGFLSTFAGILFGISAGVIALSANAPKYVLIVLTSIAGAVTTVGGILLLFNVIPLESFNYSAAQASISNSAFWTITAVILAIVGMILQPRQAPVGAKWLQTWPEDEHDIQATHKPHTVAH